MNKGMDSILCDRFGVDEDGFGGKCGNNVVELEASALVKQLRASFHP